MFNVTRYVELVIVNDFKVVRVFAIHHLIVIIILSGLHLQYEKYGKDTNLIFERSKQIVNIVNSVSDYTILFKSDYCSKTNDHFCI